MVKIGIDDKLAGLIMVIFLFSVYIWTWTVSIKDDRTQGLERRLEAIERMLEDGC